VAFVPVANSDELSHVFALAHGEKPFEQLNEYAQSKLPRSHYFLHLSDIHFGSKSGSRLQTQLETLVNTQVRTLDARDKIDFVVTGDHVNNPTDASVQSVRNFAEFLDTNSNDEAMFVLGNHDINRFGLALRHKNQRWQHIIGGYPKIKIIEDIGVIFMLFNSNTGGLFAQGEIGELQMQEMREQLARIKQLERYTLVAVLHHHVAAASYYAQVYGNDQWQEEVGRYRGREKLKRLRDADQFLDFLREYDTKFILHGHKHIPIVIDMDRILVIACGSSIGKNKDYLSYNMLKFSKHTLACTQFVEQKPDAKFKRQDIMAVVFDF
ncbi:MAG: metallophosphoesterase, partial [Coriobacteriia bacterium]|nr:metallophosphoesterase [Coriobacteriia bacterium]